MAVTVTRNYDPEIVKAMLAGTPIGGPRWTRGRKIGRQRRPEAPWRDLGNFLCGDGPPECCEKNSWITGLDDG